MSLNGSKWTGMSEIDPETGQKRFPKPILFLIRRKSYILISVTSYCREQPTGEIEMNGRFENLGNGLYAYHHMNGEIFAVEKLDIGVWNVKVRGHSLNLGRRTTCAEAVDSIIAAEVA